MSSFYQICYKGNPPLWGFWATHVPCCLYHAAVDMRLTRKLHYLFFKALNLKIFQQCSYIVKPKVKPSFALECLTKSRNMFSSLSLQSALTLSMCRSPVARAHCPQESSNFLLQSPHSSPNTTSHCQSNSVQTITVTKASHGSYCVSGSVLIHRYTHTKFKSSHQTLKVGAILFIL